MTKASYKPTITKDTPYPKDIPLEFSFISRLAQFEENDEATKRADAKADILGCFEMSPYIHHNIMSELHRLNLPENLVEALKKDYTKDDTKAAIEYLYDQYDKETEEPDLSSESFANHYPKVFESWLSQEEEEEEEEEDYAHTEEEVTKAYLTPEWELKLVPVREKYAPFCKTHAEFIHILFEKEVINGQPSHDSLGVSIHELLNNL